MIAYTLDPADTLLPDAPRDYTPRIGDSVIFHAYFNDYEALVVDIRPATGLTPERYHLYVYDELGVLTWVWCRRERLDILLTREAAAVGL